MSSLTQRPAGGKQYWRSLDELAGTAEVRAFVQEEFPAYADEMLGSRRGFLKIMGASLALAGMTGCRWPKENIVPYANRPDGRVPGIPVQFATAMELSGVAAGLLVSSYDGRPIKVEGNPQHPINQGAADVFAQASLLELYDPGRSKTPVRRESGQQVKDATWDDFQAFARAHFEALRTQGGEGLCFLHETSGSPTFARMRSGMARAFPKAEWFEYEPVTRDNAIEGTRHAFGEPLRTHLDLTKAKVILSLDADLLRGDPAALANARGFARGRKPMDGRMNRLYVAESGFTVTGAMADHRLAVRASGLGGFLLALAARIVDGLGSGIPEETRLAFESIREREVHGHSEEFVGALARDLLAHRGECVAAVGAGQPARVHAVAALLNDVLGNTGKTVWYTRETRDRTETSTAAIQRLTERMKAGNAGTLVILGGNPVYDAPADLDFSAGLAQVSTTIHLSLYDNETSVRCGWHLPRAHYLESWGDARAYDGTVCAVQPLIEPIYGGKSAIELLAMISGDQTAGGYEIVRRTFRELAAVGDGGFEGAWRRFLHDGVLTGGASGKIEPRIDAARIQAVLAAMPGETQLDADDLEIVFHPDPSVYDGRFANNGWLQELPDFITKLTWDNAALIAPKTAEKLGVGQGELVALEYDGREAECVAYIQPGLVENSVTVFLGYGRTAAGQVGDGVGFDVYRLRTAAAMHFGGGLRVRPTGRKYELAGTQDHYTIDDVGFRGRNCASGS